MLDTNKFVKQLEKAALDKAREQVADGVYDINCPECHKPFSAHAGNNTCPHCGKVVNVTFDINF